MKESIVISNVADCFIELIHRDSNPTVWIVRRSKKILWFKKQISSGWFIDGQQALTFAKKMKRENCGSVDTHITKEMPRRAE